MTTGTRAKRTNIHAVLIDVIANTITDVEIEPTLQVYYRLLRCSMIQSVPWAVPGNDMYVDEEGLFKPIRCFFTVGGQQYAGSGLIVGPPDSNGGETAATVTADEVRSLIRIFQVRTNQEAKVTS